VHYPWKAVQEHYTAKSGADEPTGALDSQTTQNILHLLAELNQQGITIVIVTHEQEVASQAQRIIRIQDGRVITVEPQFSCGIDRGNRAPTSIRQSV